MGLRIEAEPCGEESGAVDAGVASSSLALLGFRNDLARHRVLEFLRAETDALPDDLALPHVLHERIDAERGARLAGELERLGAVVRLTRLAPEPASAPAAVEPGEPEAAAVAGAARWPRVTISARAVRLTVIVGIGVAWMIRLLRPEPEIVIPFPAPRGKAPPAAVARSQAASAAVAARAQVKRLLHDDDLDGAQQAIDQIPNGDDDPVVLALQGDVDAKRGDWPAARTAYERSVQLGGADPNVFLALSGIYRQQGLQTAAVDMLHRAQQNGASGRDFEALKQVVVAEQDAETGFGSAASPHFTVSFDEGEDAATAQLILSQLEEAYLSVGHRLGEYPSHRTPVVLYAAQEFQRVTHSPSWAGALYDGRIKIPVRGVTRDTPDLARVIRHEYAHSLIMAISGGRCPTWLNEGVAMWAEEERDGDREEWARGIVQLDRPLTLAELERSFSGLSSIRAAAAYAQSYLAVRHLVARYGDRALEKLLSAFATTETTADAFREALPVELSSFEDDLRRAQNGS